MEINQIDMKKYMICDAPKRISVDDLQTLVAPCGRSKSLKEYLFCERAIGEKCDYRHEDSKFIQIPRKPYSEVQTMREVSLGF